METKDNKGPVRVLEDAERAVEKLFVYGIFLNESNRINYGMTNPNYDTVRNYITLGDYIVEAVPSEFGTLTGLVVEVPTKNFPRIDILETGYSRIKIVTTSGTEAFMYAALGSGEDYSTTNYRMEYHEQ